MRRRIVSLLPSATEIVCALGARGDLVGRSHECDYPSHVVALPICTSPKIRVDGNSEEIHTSVTSVVHTEISVYNVHADVLRDLAPTHIVTQVQCDVCAVSLRDVEASIARWSDGRCQIVALNPTSLDGIYSDIRRVGGAIGEREAAERVVASMKSRLAAVADRTRSAPRVRVATIEWISPLMAAGNWIPELVEIAGGVNVFGKAGEHSPWLDWDDLVAANPDVIVLMPCGFSIARTMADLYLLTGRPGWSTLSGRVYVTDGNQFFNRPGPRIADSAEILAELLHEKDDRLLEQWKGFRVDAASSAYQRRV
jgi:iron complex transport system substrate-binding protein